MADDFDQFSPNDVAIVGMAVRVPGARNVREFWANLVGGVESIRDVSEEELLAAGEGAGAIHDPRYVRRTADLPDMEMFDAEFFGLSPKEAAVMDPQHRQFLECAWEAMEDAGRTPDGESGPVGVFAGCGMGSYFYFNVCSNRDLVAQTGMFLLRHTGNDKDFLATRASFAFDLRGPSVNVQTACSTSLVAVHLACQSLLAGECEMAVAGGVTVELPHRRGYLFHEGEILSPDGHCRAFDHRSAGTVFGSGVGVVVLRRLSDAIADGDIIHAVIKATAVNNDGAGKAGYLAPSVTGQATAVIEALGLAGVPADTIGYVECHGTGTPIGDPIEIEALTQAHRQSTRRTGYCRVGSVKSNIGHLDTAAGVVALVKAALAVKHGLIPPSLGFSAPNPAIDFAASPFTVADRLIPWGTDGAPRRAGVNSLGVGGTNAHAIIEQAPVVAERSGAARGPGEPQLLVFSARQRGALDAAMRNVADALAADPALALEDAAFTLATGRKGFAHRRVLAVQGREEAIALLRHAEAGRVHAHSAIDGNGGAVFVFPGGGAQYVGMARTLHAEDAGFRATVEEGLAALPPAVGVEIRKVWFGPRDVQGDKAFLRPSLQLPAILITEVAVARWLMARGVKPKALIGHSMGENAAACIAGVMAFADAVNLVRLRGELFESVERGGMLSVPLSAPELSTILPAALDLASVNAQQLCVVSGRDADLEAFRAELARRGIDAARIAIDVAAHSRMLDQILPRFETFLRGLTLSAPQIPIVSNQSGSWLNDAEARDPAYWTAHLRGTVEFARGASLLAQAPARIFIEVGPGRALSSLLKLQPGISANQVINALPHADEAADDRLHLLAALGRAFAAGLDVPLARLWDGTGARRVSLPTYPFQHQRYFIEAAPPATGSGAEEPLSRAVDMADWGYQPVWRRSAPDFLAGADAVPSSFLVFLDDAGLGAPLVQRLKAAGHRVATVRVGDTFSRLAPDAFTLCPEDGKAGYEALLTALAAEGPLPQRILHLWLVTADEAHRPGSSFLNRNQEHGFYSLVHLAQALGEVEGEAQADITVVANGMQRVGAEALPYPEKATVLGPAQVLPREMPGVSVRVIDISWPPEPPRFLDRLKRAPAPGGDVLSALWFELFARPGSEVAAYRAGARWTRDFAPLALPQGRDASAFRQGGTYLITGGTGDLAFVMAGHLIERYGARIALVGRTPLPRREAWLGELRFLERGDRIRTSIERIMALEAEGGAVRYFAADVANPEAMADVLAQVHTTFGPLNGVLHTAGVVDDDLVALKSDARMDAVLGPKLHGTAVLDALLREEPLDLFVLFSSTSTDTSPAGQADYVAANAYLNAYAERERGRAGRRTVAIHWGIWNELGLAARAVGVDKAVRSVLAGTRASGPFFARWAEDAAGAPWLEAEISPTTHWVLSEHRMVSGEPVLPGTGYVEVIAQAAREYGIGDGIGIENLVFLRPLVVADGARARLRVRLIRTGQGYRVEIRAATGPDETDFAPFAETELRPGFAEPARLERAAIFARCPVRERAEGAGTLASVQERHVRFGPRWQVLRATAFGDGEAVAELRLPDAAAEDLAAGTLVHPALLDIATGFALALAPEHAQGNVLWAPVSYGRIALRGPLPEHIVSYARLDPRGAPGAGYAAFDIILADPDGRVWLKADQFVMKRLEDDRGLLARPAAEPVHRAEAPRPAAPHLATQVALGIRPAEGFEALERALASGAAEPIVSTMDLGALIRRAAAPPQRTATPVFQGPERDGAFIAPRNDIERRLAGFWKELLGVERVGVEDSFFDLGGHSLIAVRLFRMIRGAFAVDLPISALFEAPTIAACGRLIAAQAEPPAEAAGAAEVSAASAEKPLHLVPMSTQLAGAAKPVGRGDATPLFICAGMFGNVLNLRQLAMHLGRERPVFGLQARGLFGDTAPHESFEEAARDYIAEIRAVRPHGPYLLGGFSGGGLIAYEIARQLTAAGEEVSAVVMLDTPRPITYALDLRDRIDMKVQDLKREGPAYLLNFFRNRLRWELEKRRKREAAEMEEHSGAAQFHNQRVEAAFRSAVAGYEVQPYGGKVLLFRPRAEVLYRLRDGRLLQEGRNPLIADNGWGALVADLEVTEVAGDHDSMVLEPNVRVLADRLRTRLRQLDANAGAGFRKAAE